MAWGQGKCRNFIYGICAMLNEPCPYDNPDYCVMNQDTEEAEWPEEEM